MKTNNSLDQIIKLGLSEYEAKVYLALLKKKSLLAREVSQLSKVPRTRIYEVLSKLIEKGLCVEILNNVKKYKAVEPSVALNRLLHYKREELIKGEKIAQQAIHNLSLLYDSEKENVNPLEFIEVIKNPIQIGERFKQMAAEAKKEIFVFTKPPYTGNKEKLKEQTNQETELIRKGIVVKSLYEIPEDEEERKWLFNDIESMIKSGEESRVIAKLPIKMAIFDERNIILALEDPILKKLSLTSLVIEHKGLAKSLKILFNTLWLEGKNCKELLS